MMKILLINPASAGILRAVGVQFPPVGPLYLGAYLEREGYHVEIRDFCTPGERLHETIRFAKRLDTNVAQFSILTPYPGTVLHEGLKERIWTRHWPFYDSQHLVYKHEHISLIRMEWLLLKANLLYYTRSKQAMKDVWRLAKRHKWGWGTLLKFIRDYFLGK